MTNDYESTDAPKFDPEKGYNLDGSEADGVNCRWCGENPGDVALGSREYAAWWEQHESRAHKRGAVLAAIDDPLLYAIVTELT